ncbi:MAG TPA: thioesterase domain-containing protein [Puia sp.]|nr:thioesterase domain-containing protein [Puia sp.]
MSDKETSEMKMKKVALGTNDRIYMRHKFKAQLFLLHFAGGSCYSFDFLKPDIHPEIEFIPLELPGRGKRFGEDLLKNKQDTIDDYVKQIKSRRNDRPYLIYGHSMGAIIGLSVVKEMERLKDDPIMLIVSGNAGPGVEDPEDEFAGMLPGKCYLMNDPDFKKVLHKLGGIPEEVLENEDLYDFFSPIIRADFGVLEDDLFFENELCINTPIWALMGDRESKSCEIQNWGNFTNAGLANKIFEGDHFFIYKHAQGLADIINKSCEVLSG